MRTMINFKMENLAPTPIKTVNSHSLRKIMEKASRLSSTPRIRKKWRSLSPSPKIFRTHSMKLETKMTIFRERTKINDPHLSQPIKMEGRKERKSSRVKQSPKKDDFELINPQ